MDYVLPSEFELLSLDYTLRSHGLSQYFQVLRINLKKCVYISKLNEKLSIFVFTVFQCSTNFSFQVLTIPLHDYTREITIRDQKIGKMEKQLVGSLLH